MVLTEDSATFRLGDYVAFNNNWGRGSLVNGIDFTQSVTFNRHDITDSITFTWSWPIGNGWQIVSYPEIAWGDSPLYDGIDECRDYFSTISDLKTFVVDADIVATAGSSYKNISFDLWLTSTPFGDASSITTEVMVWLDSDKTDVWGTKAGTLGSGRDTATIYSADGYIAVVYDRPHLTREVDLKAVLDALAGKGMISTTDYISGYHLGAEITGGAGQVTINDLSTRFRVRQDELAFDGKGADRVGLVINATAAASKHVGTMDFDYVSYEGIGSSLKVRLSEPHAGRGLGSGDTFESIEGVIGARSADILVGDGNANIFYGRSGTDILRGAGGKDTLFGEQGNDRLFGNLGNDVLVGGAGGDWLKGGAGFDTASYATAREGVRVSLGNAAKNTGDAAGDRFNSIEALRGSGHSDILTGNARDNMLRGDGGDDILTGGAGRDIFHFQGNFGNDVITDFGRRCGARDVIALDLGPDYATFDQIRDAMMQSGADTLIDFESGRSVRVLNMQANVLSADDFSFAH